MRHFAMAMEWGRMFQRPRLSDGVRRVLFLMGIWVCAIQALDAGDVEAGGGAGSKNWVEERKFWAFREPERSPLPEVTRVDWARQPVDRFVLSRMEKEGLEPSPEADRRTWARRVALDLTGLPAAPEWVKAFVEDRGAGAHERFVDRLLEMPSFGERMASLWLPLARYAEDQAHQVGDDTRFFYPNAYRYRSWVIGAFNRDLPYDRFIQYQIAADRFSSAGDGDLAAMGFLGLGPKYYNRERLDVMADEWEDRVDTVTRTVLGLTVACARCHDHKYEPITMEDYYSLAGVFASLKMVNRTPGGYIEKSGVTAAQMQSDTLHIVAEGEVRDLPVFLRGNVDRKGPTAERRFLRILSDGKPERFVDGSGRRELAVRLAERANPLTARVYVNRVWGMFFGRPLVVTPSNFGHSGERPTHPELLDDLAVRFMEGGWSTKALVRELATSSTYRQRSAGGERLLAASGVIDERTVRSTAKKDPDNTWLSRMNRRRLGIEQWRDSALAVSGELFGAGERTFELEDESNVRRTVYSRVSRLKLNDLLMQFDYPDANVHAERRAVTTTATQKLYLLNSPFILRRASAWAKRLMLEPIAEKRVERAFEEAYLREPTPHERRLALEYLSRGGEASAAQLERLERFCQVILTSNEMWYVD